MIHPAYWVLILATALSCYFSSCSSALRAFSRTKLSDLLEDRGDVHRLDTFLSQSGQMMLLTGTLRAGLNLIVLLSILWLFEVRYGSDLTRPSLLSYLGPFAVAAAVISVFGVAIPVSLVRYRPEAVLVRSMGVLKICLIVFKPITILLQLFDPLILRVVGDRERGSSADDRLAEEILSVVEDHDNEKVVDEEQKDMLEAVIELRSTSADQIMTPRTDMKGIEVSATLDQVKRTIIELGHSRIPVYRESLDNIVGMLYAKDMIRFIGNGMVWDIESVTREAYMVPESKSVSELLAEFKSQKAHIAIVLDEYGGTAGLVTIEDILEEIVGEIRDEYEPAEEQAVIQRIDETTVEVDARIRINDLNDELDLELPEDEDYDTLGGFVISMFGHIPAVGETFEYQNITVTVTAAERTKVARVRLEIAESQAASGR